MTTFMYICGLATGIGLAFLHEARLRKFVANLTEGEQ